MVAAVYNESPVSVYSAIDGVANMKGTRFAVGEEGGGR